jgi:hypothetical protein
MRKEKGRLQKTVGKIVATLALCLLLTAPMFLNTNVHSGPPPTVIRVEPPPEPVQVDSFFDVFVYVDSFFDVYYCGIILTYDTSIMEAVDVGLFAPFNVTWKMVAQGWMGVEGNGGPVHGTVKLAVFRFHCTGAGGSALNIGEAYLADIQHNYITIDQVVNGYVTQTTLYFKPSYTDYAPSGVPDFDQKQLPFWTNPYNPVGTWSYCGPVAVANSLWWLDSEYEPNPVPPPTINDGFPLVTAYGHWDDHDPQNVQPLVNDLAFLMDTNGLRFGHQHCGTEVHEMASGLNEYIQGHDLGWKFYVHLQKSPDFFWIEDEIKKCQDAVLLLGFWQFNPYTQQWVRVGGHYVTCAGVDSTNMMLAVSDPYIDGAEIGLCPGSVLPPPPHPHTGPPETLHNDASYVSHDFYQAGTSPSPGGHFGLNSYPAEYVIDNFASCQNTPDEFISQDGPYMPGQQIFTEIEYAVVTSCKTGLVAAGSEDTNIYVWDFTGTLQWQFALGNPVVSVAMDNNGRYIAAGTRIPSGPPFTGSLWLFDTSLGGPPGNVLWVKTLNVSLSYDGGWAGTESKSVDVKYNNYNGGVVVAAATDQGLYLYDQSGNLIWHYYDGSPETIMKISQDGNYIVCVDYNTGILQYFSSMSDGVPGWGPKDGVPVWSFGGGAFYCFWTAISGAGDYVAVSVYQNPVYMNPMTAGVILLNNAGSIVWFYVLPKGGYVRVDTSCSGRSVVSVNDDPINVFGCDLNYWSDMADGVPGWSGADVNPLWTYWPGKEFGNPQTPTDDFYTVSISENGEYVATGGAPANTYLMKNVGIIQQKMGLMPNRVQSVDLTFEGKYGASVDWSGAIWFFNKDIGFLWSAMPTGAPFHCVAVSKLYPCMFPYPNHDVSTTDISPRKTVIGQGYNSTVSVTVTNEGDFTETFDVTVYANATIIGTQTVSNLATGTSITLNFIWDTTGLAKGNYTLWVSASIVTDEIEIYDNTLVNGLVRITIPGDVTGDFKVKLEDITTILDAFGSTRKPDWWYRHTTPCLYCPHSPNCDVDWDGKVALSDITAALDNFGKTYP